MIGRLPRIRVALLLALAGGALAGCAHHGGAHAARKAAARAGREAAARDWRQVATPFDRGRIRTWRDGWTQAIATLDGLPRARLAAQGALMRPDAALSDPAPPPGDYVCRAFKLGARRAGDPTFAALPPAACRVSAGDGVLGFAVLEGAQRPAGTLYANDAARLIFLGTMTLGDETRRMGYGRDPERDMAGALERVEPRRWRLVLPFPRWESLLDVIEIAPKG